MVRNNIKIFRTMNGLTQQQLAINIGISVTHINEVERCKKECSLFMLENIAIALKTTVGMLLARKIKIIVVEV